MDDFCGEYMVSRRKQCRAFIVPMFRFGEQVFPGSGKYEFNCLVKPGELNGH